MQTHRLEPTKHSCSKQSLLLLFVELNARHMKSPCVFIDIVFEKQDILLKLAEDHKGTVLGPGRAFQMLSTRRDRVPWIPHYNHTWINEPLTWLRVIPVATEQTFERRRDHNKRQRTLWLAGKSHPSIRSVRDLRRLRARDPRKLSQRRSSP